MIVKILKYLVITVVGIIVLAALIATPLIIKARSEGERMYEKYDTYTREVLAQQFSLKPYPIKAEYQKMHPWKALKLFKIVFDSQEGEKLARVNTLDATMGLFMKMYTLLMRPNYNFNLPMFSVDIIFIGGKRVFVIEIIDPAHIEDDNIKKHYAQMRARVPEVKQFEPMEVNMDWCKDIVTDFSLHFNAQREDDELLFDIYKTYLHAYLDMAQNAEPLSPEMSTKVQEGIEGYVSTLLAKGGPAVNVFKTLLGPEKQKEYVRTVMFGLDK
jgi:hypothetical protein